MSAKKSNPLMDKLSSVMDNHDNQPEKKAAGKSASKVVAAPEPVSTKRAHLNATIPVICEEAALKFGSKFYQTHRKKCNVSRACAIGLLCLNELSEEQALKLYEKIDAMDGRKARR